MRTWQEAINGEHVDARELRQIADAGVPAEVLGLWVRTLPIPMPRASDVHRIMDAAQQFPDPMSLQGKVALVKHRPDRRYWYGDRVGVVAAVALMRDDDVKPLVPSGRPAGRGRSVVPAHKSGMPTINPGTTGAQQVAGVIKHDGRMDVNRFRKMMSVEAGRSTFIEIYETDVAAANATGLALRDALSDADRLNWR